MQRQIYGLEFWIEVFAYDVTRYDDSMTGWVGHMGGWLITLYPGTGVSVFVYRR